MPIPMLLTIERSKLKRVKSDEKSDENEKFFDDDIDNYSLLSPKPSSTSNLTLIVLAIFGIGFAMGQILPPLLYPKDTPFVALVGDGPTPSTTKQFTPENSAFAPTWIGIPDPYSPSSNEQMSMLELFQTQKLTVEQQAIVLPSPDMNDNDVMELYSKEAYSVLQDKLQSDKAFRICINGGSSSAGGGNVDYGDLYFVKFADALETTHKVKTEIVNRAHGDRTSMHSAILGDSFFVPNVDLLIWEFSINDQEDGVSGARNELILWLHKLVDVYGDDPPMVLLVYLWNKPFSINKKGNIVSDVYQHHAKLAAEYNFVVGHVNLATYLNSFLWSSDDVDRYFLADTIHPNQLAHAAIAKLMSEFLDAPLEMQERHVEKPADFEWNCGDDMQEQWQIQTIFQGDVGGIAKAAFTAEIPRTTDPILPRMLLPHKEFTSGLVDFDFRQFPTIRYGKAKEGRVDRHRGVVLPCCRDGTLVFELTDYTPLVAFQFLLHAKEGVNGGKLGRRLSESDLKREVIYDELKIVVNDQDYTSRVISARDWNCLISNEMFSEWIVLDDKDGDFADVVSFCSNSCGKSIYTLEHLVAF